MSWPQPSRLPDLGESEWACVYRIVHDVAQLKSRFSEECEHFNQMIIFSSMKQPGSGVHVFKLAFEHEEDILNTDFKYVWLLHFDSHMSKRCQLNHVDMNINFKESSCLRIGPRHDATCANVVSLNGSLIAWTNELRYLGVHIIGSRVFKCSLVNTKKFLSWRQCHLR